MIKTIKPEIDSPAYKLRNKFIEALTGTHSESFLPSGATNPFWKTSNGWYTENNKELFPMQEIKHEIEFIYDGYDQWAYNGGSIMGPRTVQSYIGREAFSEAMKYSSSFRVKMKITVEPIKDE